MLGIPIDGDFLELHVELLVIIHHLAHLRPRQKVQVGLPRVVGEFLALAGHCEDGVEFGRIGMLRVLGDGKVVIALLRGIERHHLADRSALLLPLQRVLTGAVHHQRQVFAGCDPLGFAAADEPGDLLRERAHVRDGLLLAPDVVGEEDVKAGRVGRRRDLAFPEIIERPRLHRGEHRIVGRTR